tara:strand:- start:189 stop:626 length:438 start_codon:yes stop_codon:yes gene_type:complete
MSQLQLLNTTVSSIAISVNTILTASYHACYEYENEHGDQDEMMLVTAPLSSTTEIEALYNSKLIDFESALPAALHSLGSSANEITDALARRRKAEEEGEKTKEVESKAVDLANRKAEADIGAVQAQTKKTEEEAKATGRRPSAPE